MENTKNMRAVYYLTMGLLTLCISSNMYFLFHINLYRSVYGVSLSIITFISSITFLVLVMIKKRNLKKTLHAEYDKIFSKN